MRRVRHQVEHELHELVETDFIAQRRLGIAYVGAMTQAKTRGPLDPRATFVSDAQGAEERDGREQPQLSRRDLG